MSLEVKNEDMRDYYDELSAEEQEQLQKPLKEMSSEEEEGSMFLIFFYL